MPYGNDPAGNTSDAVRFLIQDTNNSALMIADAEILYLIAQHGSVRMAAAGAARVLAARFGKMPDSKTLPGMSASQAQRSRFYLELAEELEESATAVGTCGMFVGGVSRDRKDQLREDPDNMQPAFNVGGDDYPGTSQRTDENDFE